MPSSPLVRTVYGLLVAATIAAFFVTQRLKSDEPVVLRFAIEPYRFSPNGDGFKDRTRVGFDLSEPAEVSVSVIDERGDEVRTLVEGRELAGDRKHRFVWDGRNDDGRVAPDGDYRLQVSLRDEGRTLRSIKRARLDTTPPRARLAFAEPNVISPGAPGSQGLVEIAYRGPSNAAPEYRVFRTDGGPPRVVLRFRGGDTKSAFWDGRLRGPLAPDGNYAFSVRLRDRAGNAGLAPRGEAGPTAATALPGTGVIVRRLTLRGPLGVVPAGGVARFEVGPRPRRFRFALARLGRPRVLRSGARRGRGFRVHVPSDAETGLYVVRIRAGDHRASAPLAVQAGVAGQRPLVVLPSISWQGLNEEDDDLDGFGDTLMNADSVRLDRPFLGGLPPRFGAEAAPLLRFLDREEIDYDLTTDLALARGDGPSLDTASGVAFAGSALWLPDRVNRDLREFVERGGALASFGTDAFRRRVSVGADTLDDPATEARNVFGEAVRPASAQVAAPMSVLQDDLGLFEDTDDLVGLFATFEESVRLPRGAEILARAGRDEQNPAFTAYRLGSGTVVRVGTAAWNGSLEGRNEDDEVGAVTRSIFALLEGR